MRRNFLRLAAATVATALLAACGGDDDEAPTTRLRAIHASADAPAVDVLLGTQAVAAGAQFKQAGAYASVPAGNSTLRVDLAGTSTTALSAPVSLAANRAYSAIVVGSAAPSAPAGQALAPVLIDDDGAAPAGGSVKVRVVHGAPAVPAVDIYVTAPGAALPAPRRSPPSPTGALLRLPARPPCRFRAATIRSARRWRASRPRSPSTRAGCRLPPGAIC